MKFKKKKKPENFNLMSSKNLVFRENISKNPEFQIPGLESRNPEFQGPGIDSIAERLENRNIKLQTDYVGKYHPKNVRKSNRK